MVLRDFKVAGDEASKVITYLETAELLPVGGTLAALIRRSLDYVRNFVRLESVEGGLKIDPATSLPAGLTGKITLREPAAAESRAGMQSLDALINLANTALVKANYKLWILLDRLDVAFADSPGLETNALRALFKTYLDFSAFDNIRLKIFLRSDIWKRITQGGFRESSHITRHATIEWTDPFLLNLIIRRALSNKAIREYYGISEEKVLSNYEAQVDFFYKVFPDKVDPGQKKPKTFDWMLKVRVLVLQRPRLMTCATQDCGGPRHTPLGNSKIFRSERGTKLGLKATHLTRLLWFHSYRGHNRLLSKLARSEVNSFALSILLE